MSYARMKPAKVPVALTIPPPFGVTVPEPLRKAGGDPNTPSPSELEKAFKDFVHRAESSYYAEWFWFPYQSECWVNTWDNDGDPAQAVPYPSPMETIVEETEEMIEEVLGTTLFRAIPGRYRLSS